MPFDKLDVCAAAEYSVGGEAQRPCGSRAWPRAAWSAPGVGRCALGAGDHTLPELFGRDHALCHC